MENVATINFVDAAEADEGLVIIRAARNKVAICLSLRSDGDTEVFLNLSDSEKVLSALQTAISFAKDDFKKETMMLATGYGQIELGGTLRELPPEQEYEP